MNGWQYYGTRDLQVIPYMENTPVYTDKMIPYLYERTKEENKLELTFCGDLFDLTQFTVFFDKLKTMQVLAEIENDKTIKPVGYSFAMNPHGIDGARSAASGFCFFNNASKRSSARDLARLAIGYAMCDLKINVIHGIQLACNIPAQNFAHRLGYKKVATVPKYLLYKGELVDATVMMVEDVDFLPSFEKWIAEQKTSDESNIL